MDWNWKKVQELSEALRKLAKDFDVPVLFEYGPKTKRPLGPPRMLVVDYNGSTMEKLEEARTALGGRSGIGHFLQTSGRVDCPQCHHPQQRPWHQDDCAIGKVFAQKIAQDALLGSGVQPDPRVARLVSDAAEATELFDEDDLEAHADEQRRKK